MASGRETRISRFFVRRLWVARLSIAAILVLPRAARGEGEPATAGPAAEEAKSAARVAAPIREQRALDLVKRMSDTLAAAGAFTYRSSSAIELRAKTGQFVTLFADSEVALQRPNKLQVRVTGEVPNFQLYYDGRSVTAYSPKDNVYSTASAPAKIDEMLELVHQKANIHFPASDLMLTDPYAALARDLRSGFVVGPATVDGTACEHLAFRAPDSNWEIWIETQSALPRRLLVTYTSVVNFPRLAVELSNWNLTPKMDPGRFEFAKPAGAKQIDFRAEAAEDVPKAP
jgi:hypothetical protein